MKTTQATKHSTVNFLLVLTTFLCSATLLSFMLVSNASATDTYEYTGKGTVTFTHAEHGKKMECSVCHTTATPEKITIENKKQGHALCLTCHKAEKKQGNKAAPTSCKQCHVK